MKRTTHEWLAMNFAEGRAKQFQREGFVVAARNAIIRDVALPLIKELPGIEWCWFVDNDVTLNHPGLDNWLKVPGDVVSCNCFHRNENAWATEDAFHTHFWRCRPEVLLQIAPPWFDTNVSPDGCDQYGCECITFALRAQRAGFTVRHGGWCGHDSARTWCR